MKNTLDWLFKLFGCTYKVNLRTKEIHDLKNPHGNCRSDMMSKYKLVSKKKMEQLMTEGYNGCRFCLKKYDKG